MSVRYLAVVENGIIRVETPEIPNGTSVEVVINAPAYKRRRSRRTLAELLANITPENRHSEIDMGDPIGKEQFE